MVKNMATDNCVIYTSQTCPGSFIPLIQIQVHPDHKTDPAVTSEGLKPDCDMVPPTNLLIFTQMSKCNREVLSYEPLGECKIELELLSDLLSFFCHLSEVSLDRSERSNARRKTVNFHTCLEKVTGTEALEP